MVRSVRSFSLVKSEKILKRYVELDRPMQIPELYFLVESTQKSIGILDSCGSAIISQSAKKPAKKPEDLRQETKKNTKQRSRFLAWA